MAIKDLIPRVFGKKQDGPAGEDNPVMRLQREMNRAFDEFFRGFDPAPFGWTGERQFMPRIDVKEGEREIIVEAELPGMDEKDVDVAISDMMLTIRGEKKAESLEKREGYSRMERSYGAFSRSIPLPAEVEQDRISARFRKGVLTVTLPLSGKALASARKIPVKTG